MHIPSSATQELDVLRFSDALNSHSPVIDYDPEKWLYVPDFYSEYRYILGTRGKNPLICIGINPSTARPDDLDNTLKSVFRIASGNGYDSFIMFNVYAQRATCPDHMDKVFNQALHEENMKAFQYILSGVDSSRRPAIWAAWGAIIEKRPYLTNCVRDMVEIGEQYNALWLKAGKCSIKGHPHHPLYLKKDSPTEPFDVIAYLNSI